MLDYKVRRLSARINSICSIQTTPLCKTTLLPVVAAGQDVLSVALDCMPCPDPASSWQDVLDFKVEAHNKLWNFRRFLNGLGMKRQSQAEIRDDVEWSLNEYAKEMDRFNLKRSVSFMETYIIPTVEAFESFKPSSFLKGLVSIRKRKIELLREKQRLLGGNAPMCSMPGRGLVRMRDVVCLSRGR